MGFTDACAILFIAPEVERDLLKVPHSSLVEAVNFHVASISIHALFCVLLFSSLEEQLHVLAFDL